MATHRAPAHMTVQQAADYLNVCTRTVERLTASGQLPYLKIGRAVRIPTSALHAYMQTSLKTPNMTANERERLIDALYGGDVK